MERGNGLTFLQTKNSHFTERKKIIFTEGEKATPFCPSIGFDPFRPPSLEVERDFI